MKGKTLIIVIAVVLLLGGGIGGYLFLGGRGEEKPAAAPEEGLGVPVKVQEMTTNLADVGSRRIIQVEPELRARDEEAAKVIEEEMAVVKDAILQVLRSTAYDEAAGAGGMDRLRAAIRERVNAALGKEQVRDVFFAKFILQ